MSNFEVGRVVVVSGFAGTGKTTAVQHMSCATNGVVVYLGSVVIETIDVEGLSQTRENEHIVRKRLRDKMALRPSSWHENSS